MKFDTWEAIAKRHVWFRDLLAARMAEYPEARIDTCADLQVLEQVVKLAERVERHEARMSRHMGLGLALVEPAGGSRH